MAAIHRRASDERKTMGLLAFAFMILMTGTTSAVHFVNLTAKRQLGRQSGTCGCNSSAYSPTARSFLLSPWFCRGYFVRRPGHLGSCNLATSSFPRTT